MILLTTCRNAPLLVQPEAIASITKGASGGAWITLIGDATPRAVGESMVEVATLRLFHNYNIGGRNETGKSALAVGMVDVKLSDGIIERMPMRLDHAMLSNRISQ